MIAFADTKGVRSLCNKEVCLGIYTTKVVPLRLISYKKRRKKRRFYWGSNFWWIWRRRNWGI